MSGDIEVLNTDTAALTNLDGALEGSFAALSNRSTGLGTSRDKSQHIKINSSIYTLNEQERNSLVRSSKIARKVVTLYPLDAARGWVDFLMGSAQNIEPQKISDYLDNLKTGSLKNAFKEASIEGRWHGDGFILLGIDDGQSWDQPVNEKNIKSFRWAEPLTHTECVPDTLTWTRKPQYYRVTVGARDLPTLKDGDTPTNSVLVHQTRILRFTGDTLYGSALYNNANRNDSVLQGLFEAFANYFQGLFSASAMLADYSVFKYKLKGLAKLIQQGDQDAILQRFLTIQMGMSVVKGLAMDADNEDAEFVSRSYGGVKDILDTLLEQMVASSDIPRYKLLGSSGNGTGLNQSKGEQERFEWASLVHSWQVDHWDESLRYCIKLALLAKDGVTRGQLPESFGHKFRNTLQLSPVEEQELRLKKAEENKINIETGIYTPFEARMSGYGASNWSPEITLDERVTKEMEEKILNPSEPPVTTPETNSEEPENKSDSVDVSNLKHKLDLRYDRRVKKIIPWKDLKLALEYLPGEERFSKPLTGIAYGHIQNHIGEDKEALDCYVNESIVSGSYTRSQICRIAQLDDDGFFDEYKYFLGFTAKEAKEKYFQLMPSWMFGGVQKVTLKDIARFKKKQNIDSDEVSEEEFDKLAEVTETDVLTILEKIISE